MRGYTNIKSYLLKETMNIVPANTISLCSFIVGNIDGPTHYSRQIKFYKYIELFNIKNQILQVLP